MLVSALTTGVPHAFEAVAAEAPVETGAPARTVPATAAAALDQAAAAYEYGDLRVMIDSARWVAEGAVPTTIEERADGLRFLGIGLHLSGRLDGAEAVFTQLLQLRPEARLDPTTTRPEVVAFFGELRRREDRRRQQREAASKHYAWNFFPPVGQFQNGDRLKGGLLLAVEAAAAGGAIASYLVLRSWCRESDKTCPGHPDADELKTFNYAAIGVLAGAYALGVLDAVLSYGRAAREPESRGRVSTRVHILPNGLALSLKF